MTTPEELEAIRRLTYWPREIDDARPDDEYVECHLKAGDLRLLHTILPLAERCLKAEAALARFGMDSLGWTVPPADDEHPCIARDFDSGTIEASFTFGDMRLAARAAKTLKDT